MNKCTDAILSCVLTGMTLGDIEILINLHSCWAGRVFGTQAIKERI